MVVVASKTVVVVVDTVVVVAMGAIVGVVASTDIDMCIRGTIGAGADCNVRERGGRSGGVGRSGWLPGRSKTP